MRFEYRAGIITRVQVAGVLIEAGKMARHNLIDLVLQSWRFLVIASVPRTLQF